MSSRVSPIEYHIKEQMIYRSHIQKQSSLSQRKGRGMGVELLFHQYVRIKEYSCHRFNRAFSRGSFSISLSVNDAQPLHFFMWEDTGFTLYALVVLFVTACFSVGSMSLLASHSRSFFASESPWMYVHRLFSANVVIILTFCFRRQSYD